MSKNDQNTCLETPDTTPMEGLIYSSLSEDIPSLLALSVCKIRSRNVLTIEKCHSYNVTNTLQRSCAIFSIGKFAIRGLFFCLSQSKSVSRVKQHSGSDFCSLLPGNSNALPRIWRPKLAEHFPSTRIAIIGIDYFAISRDCSEL